MYHLYGKFASFKDVSYVSRSSFYIVQTARIYQLGMELVSVLFGTEDDGFL